MKRIVFLIGLLATPALADPGYFRVTGVASDDALNVREAPDGGSADIGDLAHDATGIEVIDFDETGEWARILWQEGNGWIARNYLEIDADMAKIGASALPSGLLCAGNEPFWSIRFSQTTASFSDIDYNASLLPMVDSLTAAGRPSFPTALRHRSDEAASLTILRPHICSDGMSDRDYPYAAVVLIRTLQGEGFFEGCCWLPLETGEH